VSKPIVERAARARGVEIIEKDPVDDPALAQRFDINVLPTFVMIKDNEVCAEVHGFVNEDAANRFVATCM
jgi:hypothetical protein